MSAVRRLALMMVLALACSLAAGAAAANAAAHDPGGFHLASSTLTVHENARQAVITIERSNASQAAQIRYITLGDGVKCGNTECTAVDPYDFNSVKGELDFA